ncbi:hypothetical protein GM661_04345 [Iocasia frigidifontis]|uniref:Peptidase M50 domain-containing protein n=1 Tax=Iocasia fonsfrigidae TaxID=2682810 RepID=A0A8A7KGI1_9FIRM|nr:M50 family metallopeptidase [Iocasia fonsfrigidae]QTL97264.1 hypothetical protein GM661_04345 [Iocasia fonsfrigidae]
MGFPGLVLRVNPLFLLVLLLFFFVGMIKEALIAFTIVFLHELIHIIFARYLGYSFTRLELFPFGGMAEYKGLLEMEPIKEIIVSMAGPMANLLAFAFLLFYQLTTHKQNEILQIFINYNLIIASINLIPALPLDGGRVLRGLLVLKIGFKRGTLAAVKISKYIAFICGIFALLAIVLARSNIWILCLAFFVYTAALKEEKQILYYFLRFLTQRSDFLGDMKVKELAGEVVDISLPVREAVYYINPSRYNLFFVVDKGDISGIITETKLLKTYFCHHKKDILIKDILSV